MATAFEVHFDFDARALDLIPTVSGQREYVFQNLSRSTTLLQGNQGQISAITTGSLLKIAELVIQYLDNLSESEFNELARTLPFWNQVLKSIPFSGKYIPFAEHLVNNFTEPPNPHHVNALKALCFNFEFCYEMLSSGKFMQIIAERLYEDDIKDFLKIIQTDVFFTEIVKHDAFAIMGQIFALITDVSSKTRIGTLALIEFVLQLVKYSHMQGVKLFDGMLEANGLSTISSILLASENQCMIWDMYEIILGCFEPETPSHRRVLEEIFTIVRCDEVARETTLNLLNKIESLDRIYQTDICANNKIFPIGDLVNERLLKDAELLKAYFRILNRCSVVAPQALSVPIARMIELTKPPINPEYHCSLLFEWMLTVIKTKKFGCTVMNDEMFLNVYFLENENAADMLFVDGYEPLFETLIGVARNPDPSDEILQKIFDSDLDRFINKDLSFGLVRFLVKHLTNPKMNDFLTNHMNDQMPRLMRLGNVLSVVDYASAEHMACFLRQVKNMVKLTNDHLFDEFVVKQPKSHPIFSLSEDVIRDVLYDREIQDGALYIPSLIPLVDEEYSTNSPYNLYLLGLYAIPVYRKLEKEIRNVTKICNQFLRYEDYEYLIANNLIDLKQCEQSPVACYEFIPGSTKAWIGLPQRGTKPVFVAFYIRFDITGTEPCPFIQLNDVCLCFVGSDIVSSNGRHLAKITKGTWHRFVIRKGDYFNWTNVYMDEEKIFSLGSHMNFQFIGNYRGPITTRCCVARNIIYLSTFPEEKFLKMYRPTVHKEMDLVVGPGVGCTPLHSVSMILSDDYFLFHTIDRLDVKQTDAMFDVVMEEIRYLSDNQKEYFFRRLQTSLIQFGRVDWLVRFVDAIFDIDNINLRSRLFEKLFYDVEFWEYTKPDNLGVICNAISKRLVHAVMHWEKLFEKDMLRFILGLMHFIYNRSTDVSDQLVFYTVVKTIGEKCEDVSGLVPLVMIANIWKPNFSTFASEFDISMIADFNKSNDIQLVLMQFLLYFEGIHNKKYLSYDQLVSLALCLPIEIGLLIFARVLNETENNLLTVNRLPVICLASMKYATTPEIWSRVVRKTCGINNFSINMENHIVGLDKAKVVFPNMISVLFTMAAVVTKLNDKLARAAHDTVIRILTANPTVLFDDVVFEYFLVLIMCGKVECPDEFPADVDLTGITPILGHEITTLRTKMDAYASDFTRVAREMLEAFKSDSRLYCEFVGALVLSVCDKIINERKYFKKLMNAVMVQGHPDVAALVLRRLYQKLVTQKGIKDDAVTTLIKVTCYCSVNRSEIFDTQLFTGINQISYRFPNLFVNFFLYSLDMMPSDMIDRFIDSLSSKLSVKECILLLCRLAKIDVVSTKRIDDFFMQVKDIARSESGEMAELVKRSSYFPEFAAHVRNSDFNDSGRQEFMVSSTKEGTKTKITIGEKIFNYLFYLSASNCITCFYENQCYYLWLNKHLRTKEKVFVMHYKKSSLFYSQSMTPEDLRNNTKSYHISPFGIPASPRTMMVPSRYQVVTPSSPKPETTKVDTTIFDLKPTFDVNMEVTDEYPKLLYKFSSLFQCSTSALLRNFVDMFGEYQKSDNCELVRLDLRIPSVYFLMGDDIFILTDATLKSGMIRFRKVTPNLAESVLQNEFGAYSMFCGHFVIIVRQTDLMLAHKYVSCSVMPAKMIYSVTGGCFVLENVRYPSLAAHECFAHSVEEVTAKYQNSEISAFDYLTVLNLIGYRSFSDLSAYPIFPRLISDFYGDAPLDYPKLRDLSVPVPIFADTDPNHTQFTSRMNIQKFHHAENVSNPVVVSSFNIRLLPFTRYMWDVNAGWDHADRNFLSIPFHLTISKRTAYELIPELFCFPEILINMNKFQLPEGTNFEVALPKGVDSVYNFIERHRYVLESKSVTENLHSWVDLIFGCKQASVEDLNLFSPLSYQSRTPLKDQKMWMIDCGQVPKQIFAEPCPPKTNIPDRTFDPSLVRFHVKELDTTLRISKDFCVHIEHNISIRREGSIVVANDLAIPLSAKIHDYISSDKQYIAITFSVSVVMIIRILYDKQSNPFEFKSINRLICHSPQFSVINSRELVCATVCLDNVVLWSISTGMIINFIDLDSVSCLVFDDALASIYIAQRKTLFQFTLNGNLIRKLDFSSDITSISVCGNGFSFVDRVVITGHVDGNVNLSRVFLEDSQLHAFMIQRVSRVPIQNVVGKQNSYDIDVYEMK